MDPILASCVPEAAAGWLLLCSCGCRVADACCVVQLHRSGEDAPDSPYALLLLLLLLRLQAVSPGPQLVLLAG